MASAPNNTESTLASFIWNNANDLWGDFPHTEFGKIILPFTVLRRLECVLEPTKDAVLNTYEQFKDQGMALDDIHANGIGVGSMVEIAFAVISAQTAIHGVRIEGQVYQKGIVDEVVFENAV